MRPVLEGGATTWRTAILLEAPDEDYEFYGIRTSDGRKYIEYGDGFKELYDLKTDPYELNNSYNANSPPTDLRNAPSSAQGLRRRTCRTAEEGP